jgi:hypothetical protein
MKWQGGRPLQFAQYRSSAQVKHRATIAVAQLNRLFCNVRFWCTLLISRLYYKIKIKLIPQNC